MAHLNRKLTLYGLTMIAVGSCIGSGIFATPNVVVRDLPHTGLALAVWLLGGLIALTGALTFAELGALFPRPGGVYVFLREAYGDLAGFLYGWVTLLVINTGALAALSFIFADYMQFFIPGLTDTGRTGLAVATIGGLTLINSVGVGVSQWLSNVLTGVKLLALLAIIAAGLLYYDPTIAAPLHLTAELPGYWGSALLTALIGVLFSFGGWHHASYLAGEAIDAGRTVPRAMIMGALIVTVTYVLVNLAYMLLLPIDRLAASEAVAGDALAVLSPAGAKTAAVVIAVSVFGTIGIYTMSAPRIYFAMAADGLFFHRLAYVHPRFHTPVTAMWLQAGWAILLLLFWRTFSNLITYVTFMDIAFMMLAGVSIFIFRKRAVGTARTYRTWGYPWVPLVFVSITGAFVLNTLLQRPVQAWAGIGLLALGVAVFYYVRRPK